ncbi:unnamed protein product [Rangifer tarandus platyrhynchus]|uniref:Uncharacterized protein n=1 Tax=Rangifer tarandus platyrhynchus TaxID=3082113 RepID=A0AC59Z1R7_RANTA
MAAPKRFPTLIQLEQRGKLFEVLGNLTKRPYWFHSEYLRSPKAVHLEAWLVEALFGRGGELIPHVECVSQTLLHVHQWDPDGEAEILIFGRPYYQQDVSKMIMNLADYHHQLRARILLGEGVLFVRDLEERTDVLFSDFGPLAPQPERITPFVGRMGHSPGSRHPELPRSYAGSQFLKALRAQEREPGKVQVKARPGTLYS